MQHNDQLIRLIFDQVSLTKKKPALESVAIQLLNTKWHVERNVGILGDFSS